jgi:hypothetical protein
LCDFRRIQEKAEMKKKISRRVAIIRLLILDVKPLLVVLFLLGKKTH